MNKLPLVLFLFLLGTVSVAFSQNLYVSKSGNDTNPGTEALPFLTIGKAASIAQAGTTVFIREGTYEELLEPTYSGTAGNPIVFRSYAGERVVITAMQALSNWTLDSGSIYKTTVPFTSLDQENFVLNGDTALDLARWPNNVDGLPFTLDSNRNTGGTAGSVSVGAHLTYTEELNIDWTGGALFFYGDKPGSGWLAWKAFITSSTSGQVNFDLVKDHDWIRTFHAPADLGDFYLEGVKGALDYQNEWWFDATTNELFVQLPGGVPPTNGAVQMRKRLKTIDLHNKSYIEIRDLAVFGGSIEITGNAHHNTLYGVSSFYGNHTQGVFTDFKSGKASLDVAGNNNIIEKCEIAFSATTGVQFAGDFNELRNCYIHDFDYLGSYDAPLVARGGDDNKIIGNTIYNGGRDCISYNGSRNEIAYNDVSKSNLIADDCALFYCVGSQPDTELHHNWFHDTSSRGSKFKAAGIYLDNDGADVTVHHNVVWNTEWTGIQMNWDAANNDIFNNTFWNNSEVMGAWHLAGTNFTDIRVWNNLANDDNWEDEADKQNNLAMLTGNPFVSSVTGDFRINPSTTPVDYGIEITGITDGFVGTAPDAGAYEIGDTWVAGADWELIDGPTGLGCYGIPGETCTACTEVIWYTDVDNDGLGDPYNGILSCTQPDGYIADGTDPCATDALNTCTIIHDTFSYIQAENYTNQSGIQRVTSNEPGGAGSAIGYIQNGDFSEYNTIIPSVGSYTVNFRVASGTAGGVITLSTDGSANTAAATVTNTGNFQTWDTVTTTIDLTPGTQMLRLTYTGGSGFLFDVNWIEFIAPTLSTDTLSTDIGINIYPNPTDATLFIKGIQKTYTFNIVDITGRLINTAIVNETNADIDVSTLQNGVYFLIEKQTGFTKKFIKH